MSYLDFTIQGKPIASARPRITRLGRAYIPKATREAKQAVCSAAIEANKGRPPLENAVCVHLGFYFRPPKNMLKKDLENVVRPKKPDIDNLIKTVLDGLTKAQVWKDDNLVVSISASKLYSLDERTEIQIVNLGG